MYLMDPQQGCRSQTTSNQMYSQGIISLDLTRQKAEKKKVMQRVDPVTQIATTINIGRAAKMYINANLIITTASVITALVVIMSTVFNTYRWYLKQERQDKDISSLKEELTLVCYCMGASLDGLMQLGANHTVPIAKDKLDKYINKKAHEQED